jgi:hypothetical protein
MTIVIVSHDLEDAVFLADLILLLTRRPTRIAGLLHFDLAKPHGPESIADPHFVTTQAQALEIFRAALRGGSTRRHGNGRRCARPSPASGRRSARRFPLFGAAAIAGPMKVGYDIWLKP